MVLNKKILFGSALALVLVAAGAAVFLLLQSKHPGLRELTLKDETIYVSVADTPQTRDLGLSGRAGLSKDEGMLFIFPIEGKPAFWMKDMRFAIDIVWLANDGSVIYIKENAQPESYPETYAPDVGLARYVLEVPVGYVAAHHIEVGDKVEL